MIDKALIRSRFGRAWSSYDSEALFQKEMAGRLIALYHDTSGEAEDVLELGCGTGLLSEKLLSKLPSGSRFTFNDLSPEVLPYLGEKTGTGHRLLIGDAETMEWGGFYTLIASNASIQWWRDPVAFFRKSAEHLERGRGQILLGTFLPDNFHELTAVTGKALSYPTEAEIREALSQGGFTDVRMEEMRDTFSFPDITGLLRHIRKTGTGGLPADQKGIWTPARLARMEEDLRHSGGLSPGVPLSLTYSALLLSAKR